MSRSLGFVVTFACIAQLAGCVFLDDFGDFKVGDAGPPVPCDADDDCNALDSDCAKGECSKGLCLATPINDGETCGDSLCTTCNAGQCNAALDCSANDSDCTQGVCNPQTGACELMNTNETGPCFDNDPCTVDEACSAGTCTGGPKDCSTHDDECSSGVCQATTGACIRGPVNLGDACDDGNPCTSNDTCNENGRCGDENTVVYLAAGTGTCTDYKSCTEPDVCDGQGGCTGVNLAPGTACDDDNECTGTDVCDGAGFCLGSAIREGETCNAECLSNGTCYLGLCTDDATGSYSIGANPQCYYNWCDLGSLCGPPSEWSGDGLCDCGCGFTDVDCNACSMPMCYADSALAHSAAVWCEGDGSAATDCPSSLMGDGKCDCGCQFQDPDCNGGACCGDTGVAGCNNAFIEDCLCQHPTNFRSTCCGVGGGTWDEGCAAEAIALGCMVCPG